MYFSVSWICVWARLSIASWPLRGTKNDEAWFTNITCNDGYTAGQSCHTTRPTMESCWRATPTLAIQLTFGTQLPVGYNRRTPISATCHRENKLKLVHLAWNISTKDHIKAFALKLLSLLHTIHYTGSMNTNTTNNIFLDKVSNGVTLTLSLQGIYAIEGTFPLSSAKLGPLNHHIVNFMRWTV